MKRAGLVLIIAGPFAAALVGVWLTRGPSADRPQPLPRGVLSGANVLLVTIDTLRADHVGAYGDDGALTPAIDDLARQGLVFDRTWAHVPLTVPSHVSLMTARYPFHDGAGSGRTLPAPDATTLAAVLRGSGYRTGAFVGAQALDAQSGLDRGFDVYDDRMPDGSGRRTADQVLAPAYEWMVGRSAEASRSGDASPSTPPWFAWVHLDDLHDPYTPPEPYRSRFAAEPYDGAVAYADAALGLFAGRLRAAGVLAHTLVVITSDHGEALGEHGEQTHGLGAYDATLRVPLILWAGERIRPGTFSRMMRLVDVAPTVADLLGLPPLPAVDGRSIRPFVAGERPFDDPGSYFEVPDGRAAGAPIRGLVWRRTKLIEAPVPELYDLDTDPGEQHNVYDHDPQRAGDLQRRLDAIARERTGAGVH